MGAGGSSASCAPHAPPEGSVPPPTAVQDSSAHRNGSFRPSTSHTRRSSCSTASGVSYLSSKLRSINDKGSILSYLSSRGSRRFLGTESQRSEYSTRWGIESLPSGIDARTWFANSGAPRVPSAAASTVGSQAPLLRTKRRREIIYRLFRKRPARTRPADTVTITTAATTAADAAALRRESALGDGDIRGVLATQRKQTEYAIRLMLARQDQSTGAPHEEEEDLERAVSKLLRGMEATAARPESPSSRPQGQGSVAAARGSLTDPSNGAHNRGAVGGSMNGSASFKGTPGTCEKDPPQGAGQAPRPMSREEEQKTYKYKRTPYPQPNFSGPPTNVEDPEFQRAYCKSNEYCRYDKHLKLVEMMGFVMRRDAQVVTSPRWESLPE
ncbi:hypothetical protein STCU_10047 [Strigomonas culicis]|uniref:Uncharacterized protein n=1 Tax=Strigomonas culicis TaxID=28005 RepID=S9TJN4_9TRYP|nr:hypothetical protein STCU_10047 [Strigomonas culicis]|eukprot:EPY18332.1 hypothetical protein STCU_10047 [Strigomonas culicis]